MLSRIFLFALIGFAAASDYAWKSDTEYQYIVRGRTLTALHEVDDQYAGILLKARMNVYRRAEGILSAKIYDAQYAQVHTQLPQGWETHIPDEKLSYRSMPLTQKPFEIKLKNGTVHELIVDHGVSNWEANILRSFVSQIQVDVQGENMIKSRYNHYEHDNQNDATFKTMEDTVTGKCETLYEISPLPEYILQTKPQLAPQPHLKGDGEIIEVVKSLNYTHCDERVGYHYGLTEMRGWEPAASGMGDFLAKSSNSRIYLSGNLKRHTIQSSVTTNKIVLKPTPGSDRNGLVVSRLNITLEHVRASTQHPQPLSQPKVLGNLVYRYNSPYATTNEAREGSHNTYERKLQYEQLFDSSSSSSSSSEEDQQQQQHGDNKHRYRRSVSSSSSSSSSEEDDRYDEKWLQEKPTMTQAPSTPLLPYYIGYMGRCIKHSQEVDVVKSVEKLAQQIGRELQTPSDIPKEDTLAKFITLVKLIRIMSVKELQDASRQLYTLKSKVQRTENEGWKAYRDAVAQAGTGPALLTVQEWIETEKIRGAQAATILASVAWSTRHPTEEYMHTFYNLVKKPEVERQAILNDTAVLTFAELVRRVYVSDEDSHNEFPVHTYGKFNKKTTRDVVETEYIPYFEKELREAVQEADSHKIQVYIRALGNVAHPKVFSVFEPYLEGDKDVSEFQRLLMVISMDKLVMEYPKNTRSVLYKIYQNQGEVPEVRVAAVYQLMRTSPPASMLQRMAESTNHEVHEDVNSAVKTVIRSAAELDDPTYIELATNAKAAVNLLNPKPYGYQYTKQYYHDYVVREMDVYYKQFYHILQGEDSIIPQGLMYNLRGNMGGVRRQFMTVNAMVSSIDDLFSVFEDQTEDDETEQYESSKKDSKWSSEKIARLLKFEYDPEEQLEGFFDVGMFGIRRFFTFDNHTIDEIPHHLKDLLKDLRHGQEFNTTKFYNPYEMTLSFPTATGLPFVYTLDTPTLVSLNGEIQVKTHPEVVNSEYEISTPEYFNVTTDVKFVYSSKTQSKMGFVTPFDHQHYIAGYDKKIQINLPISYDIDVDIENGQVRVELEPIEEDDDEEIFHYSSWPYTAKHDILKVHLPVSQEHSTKLVQNREPQHYETTIGKHTGYAFDIAYTTDNEYMDYRWLYNQYKRYEGLTWPMSFLTEDRIGLTNLTITYDAETSHAESVIFTVGWNSTYYSGKHNVPEKSMEQIFDKASDLEDSEDRQEYFLEHASAGINSADVQVYDFSVYFDGKKTTSYNATFAVGKSTVDKKSHVIFYYNQESEDPKIKDYEVCLLATSQIPNTNGLDANYALKFDPTTTVNVKLAHGEECKNGAKVELKTKLYKSDERVRYLRELPMYRVCQKEMEQGNYQLEGCRNMTVRANLMDRIDFDLKFDKLSPYTRNLTYKIYSAARYYGYYNLDEDVTGGHGKEGEIKIRTRFEPDFSSVNVTLETKTMEVDFDEIRVHDYVKPLVAVHPVFAAPTRYSGYLQHDIFRPTCVVDTTAATTFDNKTYQIQLGKTWHTVMHYLVNYDEEEQQHHNTQESRFQSEDDYDYVVLTRDSGNNQKEVKIVINDEKNYWEVDLVPTGSDRPRGQILINQKPIQINEHHSYDVEEDLIQAYTLPNGEVKVEINEDFYVIYDGKRVKISTLESDQFRGEVRGLCGTFDGEKSTDFTTPKNCILRNPYEFAATYAVIDETSQGPAKELQARAYKSPCYTKDTMYSNYVSDKDAEQQEETQHQRHSSTGSCSKQQTQYVEEGKTICFSVRPLPACRSPCKSDNKITKNVEVHCVQKNNVSQLWKTQIEKGASPDFSLKPVTKTVQMRIPKSCSP